MYIHVGLKCTCRPETMHLYYRSFSLVSILQQQILYLLHLYYRSFRLVSSLQQQILYLLHLYYRSFRLVSSLQSEILYWFYTNCFFPISNLSHHNICHRVCLWCKPRIYNKWVLDLRLLIANILGWKTCTNQIVLFSKITAPSNKNISREDWHYMYHFSFKITKIYNRIWKENIILDLF